MGIEVIVDSDDLEKLLYATGCIKQIESAISNQKSDPWAKSAESGFAEAHVALNKAWLGAKRNDGRQQESIMDRDIVAAIEIGSSGNCPNMQEYTTKRLRNLGLIEFGNLFEVTKWSDTGEVSSIPSPVTLVRLSVKGSRLANEYKLKREKKFLQDDGTTIDGEVVNPRKLLENTKK